MDDYPSNSIQPGPEVKIRRPAPTEQDPQSPVAQGEQKVVKKIVTGPAIKRKKTLGSRLRDMIAPDGKSIYESVVQDVLAPALKDMIADAVIQAVERAIHGEVRSTTRRSTTARGPVGSASHIAYNRYSTNPREAPRPMSTRGRGSHDVGEIVLHTFAEAEATIQQMDEFVDRYNSCSVADLYGMIGLDANYTDEKWGWTDMRGSDVRRTRDGKYILILPHAEPI